ncbi:MAG: hypothetical protein ACYDGN_18025 [Acidimicrobiales bacterium]
MSSDVAPVCLQAGDATEIKEMLEFLGDWLACAADVLAEALASFAGAAYNLSDLQADLARFDFLLDSDGNRLVFGDRW